MTLNSLVVSLRRHLNGTNREFTMARRLGLHFALILGIILFSSLACPQPGSAQSNTLSQPFSPPSVSVDRARVDEEIRTEYALGQIFFKTGDFKGSEEAFRKIVSLLKAADPKSKALGEAFFALAGIQVKLGALKAAAESYESSLALRREIDPDGPSVIESLVGLARISASSGDYVRAEHLNLEQLAILSKRVPDSVVELSCLDDLADLAEKAGVCQGRSESFPPRRSKRGPRWGDAERRTQSC